MRPASVRFRVRLTGMPTEPTGTLRAGLQSGPAGFVPAVIEGEDALLDGELRVKEAKDGSPDFAGPLVHGKPGERHLYVAWIVDRGGHLDRFRRLKLYLGPLVRASWEQPGLRWEDLESGVVAVDVPATLPDGTPSCATLPARWRSA
ncbi:MAG: hypothetical protein H6738_19565 [Alphaproteobacteria bacterium]|nr:hypothetical protein [Alphaproteobacteria bacterium]